MKSKNRFFHCLQALSLAAALAACAPVTTTRLAGSEGSDLQAIESQARNRAAQVYGVSPASESLTSVAGTAIDENSTDDEIVDAMIARLKESVERLKAIDASALPAEHADRLEKLITFLEDLIARLETDASFRHETAERERARIRFEKSDEFAQQQELALKAMCANIEKLLSEDQFPNEEMKKAVQRDYDARCKSS